ncbi:MAG: hypothetical protein KDD11_12975 [Acidobacteria bacterium]|nr:hypothetical protein [Acidobacteriota bacterium]
MSVVGTAFRGMACAALVATLAHPANASTLIRAGLDELVASHETIVVGQVVDAVSYWNAEGNFILTDYLVKPLDTVKGQSEAELTVTLMGGTVGDLTSMIVAGAELVPGRSYVLFLNHENLPGIDQALTVKEHCQGAYDIVEAKDGSLRAVSQANQHPLVPDRSGYVDAPGGVDGFAVDAMIQNLRETVERLERGQEVAQ